jgi:hypothetical protein
LIAKSAEKNRLTKYEKGGGEQMTKCSECKYSKKDWTNPNNPDHYCSNQYSDYYGYNIIFMQGCDDGEAKS